MQEPPLHERFLAPTAECIVKQVFFIELAHLRPLIHHLRSHKSEPLSVYMHWEQKVQLSEDRYMFYIWGYTEHMPS